MTFSKRAEESMRKVLSQFRSGDLSSITSVARIHLSSEAPATKWSLSNKVLAYAQAGELDCRGFKQWEQVGRTIQKGAKAVYILRPVMVRKRKEDSKELEEHYTCIGFSSVPVFSASNTTGNTQLAEYTPIQYPPLYDVAQRLGISVEYLPVSSDKLGDCSTDGSKIRLGSFDERIFFHELAHAIHAQIDGELKPGQHQQQETVAEFTAAVLMNLYGFKDTTGNAWYYIRGYAQNPLLAITKALGTVEKVLQFLFADTVPSVGMKA